MRLSRRSVFVVLLTVVLTAAVTAQQQSQATPLALEAFARTAGPNVATWTTPGVTPPKPVKRVNPTFPVQMRGKEVTGKVMLFLLVGVDGTVQKATVATPLDPLLDAESVKVASQWTFTPALKDGWPVPMAVQLEMTFAKYSGRR